MRMMFVFLLVINLLFAGWQYLHPHRVNPVVVDLPGNISSIHLMREDVNINSISPGTSNSGLDKQVSHYLCHTLGPFTDSKMTEGLKQQLQQFTNKVDLRVIEESERYRYQVYLPAKNYEAALEISKLLADRNVSDYYIMTSDGKKRVSLGHFREKAYADKRIEQLKRAGFEAETEVIYRQYQLYWLDYELKDSEKSRADELISPYIQNDISLLNRDCEK